MRQSRRCPAFGYEGERMMRKSRSVGITACLSIVLVLAAGLSGGASAQTEPEVTVAALETRVAELETEVAELTTPIPEANAISSPSAQGETLLYGDALDLLPVGQTQEVEVIAVGAPVRGAVPIAVRNNSGADVLLKGVLGIARDEAGKLAFSGNVSMMAPYVLHSGEVAIGDVYFGPDDLPDGLSYEFDPDTQDFNADTAFRQDLEVVEATRKETEIVGIVRNQTDEDLSGPFSVVAVCFDSEGAIQGYYATYAVANELAPGDTTQFTASFYGTGPCDAYLLGVNGFKGF